MRRGRTSTSIAASCCSPGPVMGAGGAPTGSSLDTAGAANAATVTATAATMPAMTVSSVSAARAGGRPTTACRCAPASSTPDRPPFLANPNRVPLTTALPRCVVSCPHFAAVKQGNCLDVWRMHERVDEPEPHEPKA